MSYFYPEALNAMQKNAADLFQRAYPDVTWNVRVVADSVTGTASVDWTGNPLVDRYVSVTINMPVRPVTYRMTAAEFESWSAYLLHEVGHPCWTLMMVWKTAVRAGKHRLLNALEDVREEKCTIDSGIALNAKHLFSKLIDSLHVEAVAKGYDPNDARNIGWTMSALGREANGYDIDVRDIRARLKPSGVVSRVLIWAMPALAACKSTQDCYDLAERVIAAVNAGRQAPEEGDRPRGGQGEKQQGEKPEGDEGKAGDEAGSGGDIPPKEEFTDADVNEVDLKPNDKDNMASSNQDTNTQRFLTRVLRDRDGETYSDSPIRGRDTVGAVAMVTGNASKMGRQRALLARAIKSPDLDDFEGGRRTGRLDRRALASAATGNTQIFGKRILVEGYDTDVQVLVDASGSMSGTKIVAASTLALVIAQAASQVGVDCQAHTFNDRGLQAATKGKSKPKGKAFGYMANQILGSTPLTVNMLRVAKEQARRAPGKRRILFLVTDGGCDLGFPVAKAAGQYVETVMGTEIANLHIGRVKMGLFRNEAAVDVNNVEAVGLRQLVALLERGSR